MINLDLANIGEEIKKRRLDDGQAARVLGNVDCIASGCLEVMEAKEVLPML